MIIKDGAGGGYEAKVDIKNRLSTLSVSEGFNIEAAGNGDSYNINTGVINLTTANESAVIYFKNNSLETFIIPNVIAILGASTSGSGDTTVELIKNPTAGTIVSGATDVSTKSNRNFGSSKEIDADAFKGSEGLTITDGELFATSSRTTPAVIEFDADVILLPTGSSLGVNVTPAPGNTSIDVVIAVVGFYSDIVS